MRISDWSSDVCSSDLVSVHQALGETAELRLDLLRSKRTQLYYQRYPALWYDNRTSNTAALLSPTVEFALPGSWTLSLGGTWSRDENDYEIWTVMAGSGDTSLEIGRAHV